jgi:SAM-dependent methyltransferase
VPGNVFTADLPEEAYDLVLLANVCHLFDADRNRALLRRLRRVLRPGGTLAVVDALPSEDPDERRLLVLYALGLRLRTVAGAVYPLASYSAWTEEAGLGPVDAVPLSRTPPLALLTCSAPAT